MASSIAACSFYKNNGHRSLEQVLVLQFDSEKMVKMSLSVKCSEWVFECKMCSTGKNGVLTKNGENGVSGNILRKLIIWLFRLNRAIVQSGENEFGKYRKNLFRLNWTESSFSLNRAKSRFRWKPVKDFNLKSYHEFLTKKVL